MKKIAIYYDSLRGKGGAQKVVIELANYLNADIITSGFDSEITKWIPIKGNVIDINNYLIKFVSPIGFLFEAPLRYMFFKKGFKYDINIFCGFTSIYGAKKGNNNIWYCFTPNRTIYDLKESKLNDLNLIKRLAFRLHIYMFQTIDQKIVENRFIKIITQSRNIQKRILKYYNKTSEIIYSPVDTKSYYFNKFGDFYLTVSRLYPEKRIITIVKAFTKMTDKKLIIVGDGPEKRKIMDLIKYYPNIQLLTDVNDEELYKLYSNCLATIYIPQSEDYGLVPIESMASGKICIAADEGGCKETIINNKTGYLIQVNELNIIKAVRSINIEKAKKMKAQCLKQSKKFDIEIWKNEWRNIINNIV